jgi:hypothetical protein
MKFENLNPFRKLSPQEMAIRELYEAQRSLLEAQSAKEYAASVEEYNASRISRLQRYIKDQP